MKSWHAILAVGACVAVLLAVNYSGSTASSGNAAASSTATLAESLTNAKTTPSTGEELLTVRADFSRTCPKGYVPIGVRNGSNRTLKQVGVFAAAYQDGRSDNLLAIPSRHFTWTTIVDPGEEVFECATFGELLPHAPAVKVFFRFDKEQYSAIFYSPGEFVPKSRPSAEVPPKTKSPGGK